MSSLVVVTIPAVNLIYPYLVLDKFYGTEPDQDAESLEQLTEAATTWNEIETNFFLLHFSTDEIISAIDWKLNTIRKHRKNFQNIPYRNKRTIDKSWPDDMNGNPNAQRNSERPRQGKQQKQRCVKYSPRGIRQEYLQRKAQEYLVQYPKVTWNEFSTHFIQDDIVLQVSVDFQHDLEQIKTELATLGQETRNLQTKIQKYRFIATQRISRSFDLIQSGKNKTFRICYCCHKTGTLQIGVAKKGETKKYEKCAIICS